MWLLIGCPHGPHQNVLDTNWPLSQIFLKVTSKRFRRPTGTCHPDGCPIFYFYTRLLSLTKLGDTRSKPTVHKRPPVPIAHATLLQICVRNRAFPSNTDSLIEGCVSDQVQCEMQMRPRQRFDLMRHWTQCGYARCLRDHSEQRSNQLGPRNWINCTT